MRLRRTLSNENPTSGSRFYSCVRSVPLLQVLLTTDYSREETGYARPPELSASPALLDSRMPPRYR
jgi:hypothetical protein